MSDVSNEFNGPYQIRNHPDGDMVFINIKNNCAVYSYDSLQLRDIVTTKLVELNAEVMKWNILMDKLE